MSIPASRTAVIAILALALSVLAAPGVVAQEPSAPDPRGVDPASPNPLVGLRFFVDHEAPAWRQYLSYRGHHRGAAAVQIWKLAKEPKFRWYGRWDHNLTERVDDYVGRAEQDGSVPLIAVMRAQSEKCGGSYGGGSAAEDARTRSWYRTFAHAVGDARAVIGFEPDSLGTINCLRGNRRQARLDLLRYGVDVLAKLPNATVYLEGGASDWEPAARTARQLRYIGVSKVRGFMLNVTHYDWTGNNILHGLRISRMTGGKPFVISTSFNGRGPVHFRRWISRSHNIWRTV